MTIGKTDHDTGLRPIPPAYELPGDATGFVLGTVALLVALVALAVAVVAL